MTPQISGPRCDSDIKPDRYKSLVRESRVQQQISVIVKGNKIQLGFDNKYPENNQRVPRQRETWTKNCPDEWFYFLCGVIILWVWLC